MGVMICSSIFIPCYFARPDPIFPDPKSRITENNSLYSLPEYRFVVLSPLSNNSEHRLPSNKYSKH